MIKERVPVIDAQCVIHRRQYAAWRIGFRCRKFGVAVRRTDDLSHLQATTGIQDAHRSGPVIATCTRIDFRRATEFAQRDHQHIVLHSPTIQILHQGRHSLIILWQQVVFELLEIVAVRVPSATGLHRHEGNTGFNQTSGQQAALPQIIAAVTVPHGCVFAPDIKGPGGLVVGHHFKPVAIERIEPFDVAVKVDVAADLVQ